MNAFLKLMTGYCAPMTNTTKTVTARSFLDAAKVPFGVGEPGDGPAYLPKDIRDHLASAVIVYGTTREAGTNRYAAEQLQIRYRDRNQREVPIYKDFEGTEAVLAHKDVIFVGRPETEFRAGWWREKDRARLSRRQSSKWMVRLVSWERFRSRVRGEESGLMRRTWWWFMPEMRRSKRRVRWTLRKISRGLF